MHAKSNRVLPVVLVSDRERWLRALRAFCKSVGVVPEVESWPSAPTRRWPLAALVLDLSVPFEPKRAEALTWSRRGWQPVCVLCISPRRGAAELDTWARSRGYRHVFHGVEPSEYRDDLERCLGEIVDRRLWLVVELARALNVKDREAVRALAAGLTMIPEHNTVEYWSDQLGLRRRQDLARLFKRVGLPRPKWTLRLLRLARVLEHATAGAGPVRHTELAARFGYSDARYLRRVAKELTGEPLGRLTGAGLEHFFDIIARGR